MESKEIIDDTVIKEQEVAKTKSEIKLEAHTKRCEELAQEYSKSYPSQNEFYITSDYQVFLNLNRAQSHQRSCKSGEVLTVKVK